MTQFIHRISLVLLPVLLLTAIAACGENDSNPAPTAAPTLASTEVAEDPTPTATDTPGGPTLTPSPTFRPTLTPTSAENTAVAAEPTTMPSATPPPYQEQIESGDTCSLFAVRYDVSVDAIQAANPGVSCASLQLGQVIVIPRPTLTPTPFGQEMTATAFYEALAPGLRDVTPYAIYEYCPEEGDTLRSISLRNSTTDLRICQLNPLPDGLDCRVCEFGESGQASCSIPPVVSENRCYNVPGPTYTPPPSPTPDASVTITPTPTHIPPQVFYPANGGLETGTAVRLMWAQGSGQLLPDQLYQVIIVDEASGAVVWSEEVQRTDMQLPDTLRPVSGSTRTLQWTVQIVRLENELPVPVSDKSPVSRFVWQAP